MAGIQLIGKADVLSAFDELDCEVWALFQGKQLLICGEGLGSLEAWLDRFYPAGSTAQYTLRAYETPLPVNASTPYYAAFNFKLVDMYAGIGIAGAGTKMEQRIAELEKKINGEDSEDNEDLGGILMGWLKEPDKLETAVGAIKQMFGLKNETAGIMGYNVTNDAKPDNDRLERLAAVLDRLEAKDKNLIENLEKLADLDQLTYNIAINKLNAI